jgi:quercetin dioxygenase-like cupin family protein
MNLRDFKCLVTGQDKDGKSFFSSKDLALPVNSRPEFSGARWVDLWAINKLPIIDKLIQNDLPLLNNSLPTEGQVLFRILEIDSEPIEIQLSVKAGAAHPGFHKTETFDFIYVISGEIWAILEKEEKLLKQGDALFQRGTIHSWSNRSKAPCQLLGVIFGVGG